MHPLGLLVDARTTATLKVLGRFFGDSYGIGCRFLPGAGTSVSDTWLACEVMELVRLKTAAARNRSEPLSEYTSGWLGTGDGGGVARACSGEAPGGGVCPWRRGDERWWRGDELCGGVCPWSREGCLGGGVGYVAGGEAPWGGGAGS